MLAAGSALFAIVTAANAQTSRRLRITNGCASAPIWIAHEAHFMPDPQNVKIDPLMSYDFGTEHGVASARYWPKMFCDASGQHCGLGGSGGNADQGCSQQPGFGECAPPIDTKFEATFHAHDEAHPGVEYDYVDVSLVDGFTLPFRLTINGRCDTSTTSIDCSGLTFDSCPASESLSSAGITADLKLKNPTTGLDSGCYSPCTKLIAPQWNNAAAEGGRPATHPAAVPYCCPTPPESPSSCRAGPGAHSQYVQTVHQMCPGVYGYAYDDGMGLIKCDTTTTYEMTYFCPSNIGQHAQGNLLDLLLRPFRAIFHLGSFPSLAPQPPIFTNPFVSISQRFGFGQLYSKEITPGQHASSSVLLWLLASIAVAMVAFSLAIAVRNWRRRAYQEVRPERPDAMETQPETTETEQEATEFLRMEQPSPSDV